MLRSIASVFLMPPAANLLLILLGWVISRYWRHLGGLLIVAGVASLWLLATPIVSSRLHASIEQFPALDLKTFQTGDAQAIIVLGAAHYDAAGEFMAEPAPVAKALSRLHYAAYLHRKTGLPLMTTGGPMNRDRDIHSAVLESALAVYDIPVKWKEQQSATTWQNALFSAEILRPQGIHRVVVVTHSYHMRRTVYLFEQAGFEVIPAPTQLSTSFPLDTPQYWLPDSNSLDISYHVLHEYLGLVWYRLVSPVGNERERDYKLSPL